MLSLLLTAALAAPPGPGKEPAYRGPPRYLALSFAADGADRVWLALDGDTLHVDRNGNGDLTDPGEAVTEKSADGEFVVDTVAGDGRTHRRLTVGGARVKQYAEGPFKRHPAVKAALARDPDDIAVRVGVEVARPGLTGAGLDGRARFTAFEVAPAGLLTLGRTPAAAPVLCFGGPLVVTLGDQTPDLRAGASVDVTALVGVAGVGPAAFAALAYEDCIPDTARPVVELTLPGPPPVRERFELKDRC